MPFSFSAFGRATGGLRLQTRPLLDRPGDQHASQDLHMLLVFSFGFPFEPEDCQYGKVRIWAASCKPFLTEVPEK